jgi:tRNA(Ile)-lysidine synthase
MLEGFIGFIKKEKLFRKDDKILLAVSGGADSVCMCSLFKAAGYNFGIAHCNFKLRGKESDEDALFVRNLAKKHKVPFHSTSFETEKYAKSGGISIQMAARELRYNWLEKTRSKHSYSCIALAHHEDDIIETFFINLTRGTGISGLHGILPKNGFLVRPLLSASKEQIISFCTENNINFREDSSNSSDKYIRNKIRHKIIPVLLEINPSFRQTFINNIDHFKLVEKIYYEHLGKKEKLLIKKTNKKFFLSIKKIKQLDFKETYLFEFLKPFNFNYSTVEDIIRSLENEPGRIFYSSTHRLLKDREDLILEEIENKKNLMLHIYKNTVNIDTPFNSIHFQIKKMHPINKNHKTTSFALLDYDKLVFPLILRKWKSGDWFYPLGMNSRKKLSDFFIDNKIPLFEKERTLVLCSEDNIVWVVGHRINNLYKIGQKTKNMYIAQVL